MSDREQVFAAVVQTRAELGSLDIMVNNAGIVQVEPLLDVTSDKLDAIVGVNLNGVVRGIQAAAATFREHGTKGAIINASSIAGHDGFAMLSAYCATKFAVRALTQSATAAWSTADLHRPGWRRTAAKVFHNATARRGAVV